MSWEIRELIHVVVGILQRDGKVLVAERPPGKPYSGYWEFPGGKVEAEETGLNALKRELHEELGIEIFTADFWFDHQHTYPDKTVHLEMWRVTEFTGEPQSNEGQQLRWVNFNEIMELKLLEGNWPIINKIQSIFLT